MNSKAISAVFLALVFGLSIVNFMSPPREFSEQENRYLEQMPTFSAQSLFDGRYTSKLDKYLTDQFVFRDKWVSAKALSELLMNKKSTNGVYFSKDGGLVDMFDSVDLERYNANLGHVAAFSQIARDEYGIEPHTLLIPSASMILSGSLPLFTPEVDQGSLLQKATEKISGFCNMAEMLSKHFGEYIYFKTDHHWTSLGAFYCYNEYMSQIGRIPKKAEDYSISVLSDSFFGTAYSKASLPGENPDVITAFYPKLQGAIRVDYNNGEKISDTIYEESYLELKDKYSVFLNANQPVTTISTGVNNGKKLLIIKDSYANAFVQFLISDYEEIIIVDPRYYRKSYKDILAGNGITDLLILYSIMGFSSDTNLYYLSA